MNGALVGRSELAQGEEEYSCNGVPFLRGKFKGEGAKVKEGEELGELVSDGLIDNVLAVVGFLAA